MSAPEEDETHQAVRMAKTVLMLVCAVFLLEMTCKLDVLLPAKPPPAATVSP